MSNIELIMNPYVAPIYISESNAVLPINTITVIDFFVNVLNTINYILLFIRELFAGISTLIICGYTTIDMIISLLCYRLAEISGLTPYTIKMMSIFSILIVYLGLKHCVDYDINKDINEEFNALETKLALLNILSKGLDNKNKALEKRIEFLENMLKDLNLRQAKRLNNIDIKIRKLNDDIYY